MYKKINKLISSSLVKFSLRSNFINYKKRGQITLFIIIGLVILLGTIVIIYISNLQKEKVEVSTEKLVSAEIPSWAEPINQYTQECIQAIAIKGFKAIGEHGGYIDLNDEWLSGGSFSINKNPTESDAVLLSKQGFSPVVYWWYLKSPNDCVECEITSLTPLLPEIEEQMNRYIDRELEKCINNFSVFREQGFQLETGAIKTNTLIQKDNVDIFVDYPVDIARADSRTLIPNFYINLDLRFREIFELAFLTTLNQIENQTQEDILMHLIGIYSSVSSPNKMAPIGWLDHKKSTITWNLDTIKENLKQYVLGSNIPSIQIDKTRDAKHITVSEPIMQGLYDIVYLKFLTESYPNLAVNFLYDPNWEIYLDVTPRSGKLLSPTTTSQDFLLNILPSKNTNFYQFFYDISYPIIVTIRDDYSLKKYGEKGYTFMFALEINVRDNKDLSLWKTGQGTIGEVDYDSIRASFKLSNASAGDCIKVDSKWKCSLNGQEYLTQLFCIQNCAEKIEYIISDTQKNVADSLFCQQNQRISKNITVNVFNQQKIPLNDVSISYKCGNHKSCSIGSTDSNGKYIGRFPICIGDGFLKLEKEGYLTKLEPHVSVDLEHSNEFNIYLEKLERKEVEVAYINVTNLFRMKRDLIIMINDLIPLMDSIQRTIRQYTTSDELSPYEEYIALREIRTAKNKLKNARKLIEKIEHYYQADRAKVVRATKLTKEATESAYNIVYGLNIEQGILMRLRNRLTALEREVENIQFLEDYELVNNANIQEQRDKTTGLQPNEEAVVTIEKIKENQYEQNIPFPSAMVGYNQTENISLASGQYAVTITSQDKVGYTIPKESLISTLPTKIPGYGNLNIVTEDVNFTYIGGTKIDDKSGYWIITEEQLRNTKKVRFYIFRLDKAENMEDLGEVEKIEYYSKRYRAYIEPEFLP